MRSVCLFLLHALVVALPAWAAGDPSAGKPLYAACAACHGAAGEGVVALGGPALAAQDAVYLERQLRNFRSGIRGADPADTSGAQMRAMVATLADDKAVADVSAYLASLPPVVPAAAVEGDLRNGHNFYQSKCGACHGGVAQGSAALFAPRLAGLDIGYLKRQYLGFQQGLRGTHPEDRYGKQMKFMANSLPSDKDLDDVLAFIHAQGAQR